MAGEATEVQTEQVIGTEQDDDGDDDDFTAGFASTEAPDKELTTTPAPTPAPVAASPAPAAPAPTPAPKYAKVTEEDLQSLLAMRTDFAALKDTSKRNADTMGGRVGQLKATLDALQAATQQGKPVEVTDEDVAEITALYPDLGKSMLEAFKKVAGKLKGTGVAVTAAPAFDPSVVDQRLQQYLPALTETVRQQVAAETLEETHPDWKTVAGAPGSNTEFRVWLGKQPDDYGNKVLNSNSPALIGAALTKFKASKAPVPSPAPAAKPARAGRFADAVQPKGNGAQPVRETDDDFEKGFAKYKPH